MVLFKMVIRIAAQTLALTGIMLLSSAIIWATNRNYTELQIPFEDGILTTKYGLHWYLALVMGKFCGQVLISDVIKTQQELEIYL
ncbi:hypothetical protein E2C01_072525 [Portunus trituberculatus]|uniref:Uncharacterized protein n=1 Tax=Portunus trituberculatus TaxID=210409 RepID=A0A5B7HY99_PORTR|nr:hypothetical protein [Portunus trituberculatus]